MKVTREGIPRELGWGEDVAGTESSGDWDWDTSPVDTGTANAELNIEGGQSVIHAHGSMGATETIDPTLGNVHTGTLDADVTYTLSAPVGSGACEIEFQRTASGTHTETWPGSVSWMGGVAPDPPADGDTGIVILRSLDGGTTWLGIPVGGAGGGSPATTVEAETTLGITPAVGTDTEYARQDHTHGSPSSATIATAMSTAGFVGELLISDSPSTPLVFADLLQNEAEDDLLYADIP